MAANSIPPAFDIDVCIVGGGICGLLAGHRCVEEGLSYKIIEKGDVIGGCWQTVANDHSHLQVRGHDQGPLVILFTYPFQRAAGF